MTEETGGQSPLSPLSFSDISGSKPPDPYPETVEEYFNWENITDDYLKILEETINK